MAPCLYVYDQYPGGIGLSEGFLGNLPRIITGALEVVARCPCENGCPSCIGAPDEQGAMNAKSAVRGFLSNWSGAMAGEAAAGAAGAAAGAGSSAAGAAGARER